MAGALNQLRVDLAELRKEALLTLQHQGEKIGSQHDEISAIFLKLGEIKTRLGKIERWQSELYGQASARGSAWGWAKWVVGLVAGLIGALAGALLT